MIWEYVEELEKFLFFLIFSEFQMLATEEIFCSLKLNRDQKLLIIENCNEIGIVVLEL